MYVKTPPPFVTASFTKFAEYPFTSLISSGDINRQQSLLYFRYKVKFSYFSNPLVSNSVFAFANKNMIQIYIYIYIYINIYIYIYTNFTSRLQENCSTFLTFVQKEAQGHNII